MPTAQVLGRSQLSATPREAKLQAKYNAIFAQEDEAKRIADKCRDAYSADAYANWTKCALVCLKRGLNAAQTEAVLRSKWTRWARDQWNGHTMDDKYPAKALDNFLKSSWPKHMDEVNSWVRESRRWLTSR